MNIIRYLGRGVYHEDTGVPCQDRARYRYAKNGNVILAIADGCSSAAFAETAADVNVDTVLRLFSNITLRDFLRQNKNAADVIDPILAAMKKKHPGQYEKDPTEFSATLLFAVTDGRDILLGHLGDGNLICADSEGGTAFYSKEENQGSASSTYFTVSPDAKAHLRLDLVPAKNVRNILLYSDGPQKMLWYNGDKDIEKAALALISHVRSGEIKDCRGLTETLTDMIADAMYQLMDDWSMLILDTEQKQCRDLPFDPVSMKQAFMKRFQAKDTDKEEP